MVFGNSSLEIQAGIGVYDHEHGRLQPLIIDVTLELAPAVVESLADTINYEDVDGLVDKLVERTDGIAAKYSSLWK